MLASKVLGARGCWHLADDMRAMPQADGSRPLPIEPALRRLEALGEIEVHGRCRPGGGLAADRVHVGRPALGGQSPPVPVDEKVLQQLPPPEPQAQSFVEAETLTQDPREHVTGAGRTGGEPAQQPAAARIVGLYVTDREGGEQVRASREKPHVGTALFEFSLQRGREIGPLIVGPECLRRKPESCAGLEQPRPSS
jgi:hypothetical protein